MRVGLEENITSTCETWSATTLFLFIHFKYSFQIFVHYKIYFRKFIVNDVG